MSSISPPSYTPETPSYTTQPRGGEQTLRLASRRHRPAEASNLHEWSKKVGRATLTLTGQTANHTEFPVYGRNAIIEGFVTLDSTQDVASVRLKLDGRMKCKTIAEIGSSLFNTLSNSVTLWSKGGTPCPTQLPFEVPLPGTFTSHDKVGLLPPSFEYTFHDVQGGTPGLRARIKYEISVEVEHSYPSLKDRLTATLSTPFIYLPRSRPVGPPSDSPTTAFESVMEFRGSGKRRERDPIFWKLRLPPPGTYAISQPVPFRVTVTSRSSSLLTPFAPTTKRDRALIRVYILRQVSIKVNTIDLWRSYVIGEGVLTYLPQEPGSGGPWLKNQVMDKASNSSSISVGSLSEREGWASHDWSGVVKVDREDIAVGGFETVGMTVKDFIILSVVPPHPRLGDLLEVKRVVPIQLTTDTWDTVGHVPLSIPFETPAEVTPESNGYLEGQGEGHHVEVPHRNEPNGDEVYRNGQ